MIKISLGQTPETTLYCCTFIQPSILETTAPCGSFRYSLYVTVDNKGMFGLPFVVSISVLSNPGSASLASSLELITWEKILLNISANKTELILVATQAFHRSSLQETHSSAAVSKIIIAVFWVLIQNNVIRLRDRDYIVWEVVRTAMSMCCMCCWNWFYGFWQGDGREQRQVRAREYTSLKL